MDTVLEKRYERVESTAKPNYAGSTLLDLDFFGQELDYLPY